MHDLSGSCSSLPCKDLFFWILWKQQLNLLNWASTYYLERMKCFEKEAMGVMRCDCEMSLAWQRTANLTSHTKKWLSFWSAWSLVLCGFESLCVWWAKYFLEREKLLMSSGPLSKCKGKKLAPWLIPTAFIWYVSVTYFTDREFES